MNRKYRKFYAINVGYTFSGRSSVYLIYQNKSHQKMRDVSILTDKQAVIRTVAQTATEQRFLVEPAKNDRCETQ